MPCIAVVGLGVMGANLARNLAGRGVALHLFDHDAARVAALAKELGARALSGLGELASGLSAPRVVLMMVPAGEAVDQALDALSGVLEPGDVVIDGGNSHWRDSERRSVRCRESGVAFLGTGISGGAEGALTGAAVMAGGDARAFALVRPMLEAIAARVDGAPCCALVGPGGAGHLVKTVHNGIEYALMQTLGELWALMHGLCGLPHAAAAAQFGAWGGYLPEATAEVLALSDAESGRPLLEVISDRAGQKGTGRWAAEAALELGVAAPSLAEAVAARCQSAEAEFRMAVAAAWAPPVPPVRPDLAPCLRDAWEAAALAIFAQGFQVIAAASARQGWETRLAAVARLWRGGCIIRSPLLVPIAEALDGSAGGLLRDAWAIGWLAERDGAWRRVVAAAVEAAIPVPALSSALAWVDGARRRRSDAAALIQAQRDHFGRHGFGRVDRPGVFHLPEARQ